jgi:hypothetical protein
MFKYIGEVFDMSSDFLEIDDDLIDAAKYIYKNNEDKLPEAVQSAIIDAEFKDISEKSEEEHGKEKEKLIGEGLDISDEDLRSILGGSPRYDLFPLDEARPFELFEKPIYNRQPGESNIRYQQFLTYASIPVEKRSFAESWRKWIAERRPEKGIRKDGKLITMSGDWTNAARHWLWEERAYSLDVSRLRLREQQWIERDIERREKDWEAAATLREKALEALEKLESDDITTGIIARYIELASNIQERTIPHLQLNQTQIKDLLSSASDEKRGEVIRILMAEIKR